MGLLPEQIDKFKWSYPSAIRRDPDAPAVLELLDLSPTSLTFILSYRDPYVLFQACACVCLVLRGIDEAFFRLVSAYFQLRRSNPGAIVEAILTAINLITARSRAFEQQAEFLEIYLADDPSSPYANNAKVTNAMLRGDVEWAESFVRNQLHPDSLLYYQMMPYWAGLLLMHQEISAQSGWLIERATLDGNPPDFLRRVAAMHHFTSQSHNLPTLERSAALCINMAADAGRWQCARKIFAKTAIRLERIDAVAGAGVPGALRLRAAQRPIEGGEFGCFASHLAAWERVATATSPQLILEDDAFPAFPFSLNAVIAALPTGSELAFLNARFLSFANVSPVAGWSSYLEFQDIDSIVPDPNNSITGGEGYILSPEGARRLIAMYQDCGMPVPVDWFVLLAARRTPLLTACMGPWQLAEMARMVTKHGVLQGCFASVPPIICDDLDYSPRRINS